MTEDNGAHSYTEGASVQEENTNPIKGDGISGSMDTRWLKEENGFGVWKVNPIFTKSGSGANINQEEFFKDLNTIMELYKKHYGEDINDRVRETISFCSKESFNKGAKKMDTLRGIIEKKLAHRKSMYPSERIEAVTVELNDILQLIKSL